VLNTGGSLVLYSASYVQSSVAKVCAVWHLLVRRLVSWNVIVRTRTLHLCLCMFKTSMLLVLDVEHSQDIALVHDRDSFISPLPSTQPKVLMSDSLQLQCLPCFPLGVAVVQQVIASRRCDSRCNSSQRAFTSKHVSRHRDRICSIMIGLEEIHPIHMVSHRVADASYFLPHLAASKSLP
jgi:hypothetical protein